MARPPALSTITYVFVYSPGPLDMRSTGPRGPKRKLYSAVPGRTFIAVKSYEPQGPGEIQLNRGERVKGKCKVQTVAFW